MTVDAMAEWSKALDLGSSPFEGVGSNPTRITFLPVMSPSCQLHSHLHFRFTILIESEFPDKHLETMTMTTALFLILQLTLGR